MDNSNIFKDFLLKNMQDGLDLDAMLSSIAEAATQIEFEQENKYDKELSVEGEAFINRITHNRISLDDMAIIYAHYLCQNVPDYEYACAKDGIDLVAFMRKIIKLNLDLAQSQSDTKDKGVKAKVDGLLGVFYNTVDTLD